MKTVILILLAIGFSNLVFSQIKSERQVKYWLHKKVEEKDFHKNTSKDSCVIFWKEYNRKGKITKEYDFPSDRCWTINGPWENHYYYDDEGRIIEHRYYGGEEGKRRTLMKNFFYSYPYADEPNRANEFYFIYDYKAKTRIEEEQIDTFYLDTVNTKGMFSFFRTGWKYDTIRYEEGSYIFKEGFERKKDLFKPDLILAILSKSDIKGFEIALIDNLNQICEKLTKVYETDESYFCEFEFREEGNRKNIKFKISKYFLDIEYNFLNLNGDCYLSFFYRCDRTGSNLKKLNFVKSYIEFY
jgi:uncharacterized protein YxeA